MERESPERLVLDAGMDYDVETEHLNRYLFACQLVSGKRVLDIACGSGYGSYLLSRVASHVIGMDVSNEAISMANERYRSKNLEFLLGDVTNLACAGGEFDVVVSFETLEHVSSMQQELFLKEISRVLRSNGMFVCSTPNRDSNPGATPNAFHVHELSPSELSNLLRPWFKNIINGVQFQTNGNAIVLNSAGRVPVYRRGTGVGFDRDFKGPYQVVVASNESLPPTDGLVLFTEDNPEEVRVKAELVAQVAAKDEWIGVLEAKAAAGACTIKDLEGQMSELKNLNLALQSRFDGLLTKSGALLGCVKE